MDNPAPLNRLTDAQIIEIRRALTAPALTRWADTLAFARAIEAALMKPDQLKDQGDLSSK